MISKPTGGNGNEQAKLVLDQQMKEELTQAARTRGVSQQALVRAWLRERLDRENNIG